MSVIKNFFVVLSMNDTLINGEKLLSDTLEFTVSPNTYTNNILFPILLFVCIVYYSILVFLFLKDFVVLLDFRGSEQVAKVYSAYVFLEAFFTIFDFTSLLILINSSYDSISEKNKVFIILIAFKLLWTISLCTLYFKVGSFIYFMLVFILIRCFGTLIDISNLANYSDIGRMFSTQVLF